MSKSIKNNEARIVGDWEPRVNVSLHGRRTGTLSRKVVTRNRRYLVGDLSCITYLLRRGYEVILTDRDNTDNGIRLYPCTNKDLSAMFVAAQTVGDFRHAISDIKFTVRRGGIAASPVECRRMVAETAERATLARRESACPTRVVACPKCGYEFEIGGLKAK